MTDRRAVILGRILSGCVTDPESGCWIWQGSTSGDGRGGGDPRMKLDGATVAVHRAAWVNENGLIPPRKQLDHIFRRRLRCNPAHLEMVTHRENMRRRDMARGDLCNS